MPHVAVLFHCFSNDLASKELCKGGYEHRQDSTSKAVATEQKAGKMRLIVDEVIVMSLCVALVMVLLNKATATQLAPVWVLGAGAEQAAQKASGSSYAAVAIVVVMVVVTWEAVLEHAAVVGGQVLLQVVLACECSATHLTLVRALTSMQPHVAIQLGPIVTGVWTVIAGELALLSTAPTSVMAAARGL